MDDVFGPGLQKSGVDISRTASRIKQGFDDKLGIQNAAPPGKLSSDLDLVAALTDENVPLQPEGTTQTLQELDKVFIELKNPHYGATLGDFVYERGERQGGEFGRLSRKLQGILGTGECEGCGWRRELDGCVACRATARRQITTTSTSRNRGKSGSISA